MRGKQMLKSVAALVMVCGSAAAYVVGYHVGEKEEKKEGHFPIY